jgi:hypothetical protein
VIAQDRGDYGTAEQCYQASLAIEEELANRVGIASTLSPARSPVHRPGSAADAISHQIQSLAIRTEISSPDSTIDVPMLRKQRAVLGDQQFQRILRTLIEDDAADVAAIMQLTEQAG